MSAHDSAAVLLVCLLATAAWLPLGAAASPAPQPQARQSAATSAPDTDGDGVTDSEDDCVLIVNADQRDSDADGFGNACDPDLDGDGVVDADDAALLRQAAFGADPDADLSGNGTVGPEDAGIMKERMFAAPGPSGLVQAAFAGHAPVPLDYMDNLTSWVVSGTRPKVTLESAAPYVRHGSASIRMRTAAHAGDTSRIIQSGLSLDLSAVTASRLPNGRRLNVWLYAPTWNPDVGSQGVQLALASAGPFVNYFSVVLDAQVQGWNRFPLHASDFTVNGAPSWANIEQIRFTMPAAASYAKDVTVDFMETQTATPPAVLLAFDDGNASAYTVGFAEAHARSIPLTLYVITQNLGLPNRLTSAQVDEMYAGGVDVGLHDAGTWDVGTEDQIYALLRAQYDVVQPRWPRAARHLAWPQGRYGQHGDNVASVFGAAQRLGILTGRAVAQKRIQAYGGEFDTPLALGSGDFLDDQVTLAQIERIIQQAIETKTTVFITGHKLEATAGNDTWAIADYVALLDWLAQKRAAGQLRLSTVSSWYRSTTAPPGG